MNTKELIEKVIVSGILLKELTELSLFGATDNELAEAENRVGEKIDEGLKELLRAYNGANLDVIRFYATGRIINTKQGLKFADDPSGFVFYVNAAGEVISEDLDGGNVVKVASSVREFILSYLFGERSAEFAGEEWHQELIKAKITT
ncbi:MAG: SMI1/KNR4 family protein [Geobacteraceae bacterium]|nr:SMI1/KNR4 family protein [Geobacteraceae bacterium]